MQPERPLVYIRHPDAVMTAGIAALLDREGFDIVKRADDAVGPAQASVIVTDHGEGIRLAQEYGLIPAQCPPILVITSHDKEFQVRNALDAGVHGYLLQDCSAGELGDAVRQLARGGRYVSARVAGSIADSLTRAMLTPRETDVLQLLASGRCNKLIARELDIGVGTVKTHIKGLLTKLGAKARTHAVVIASQRGLIEAGAANLF
ncbi:MAG TPA: response regulator transcription factor [Pseudoduganella sp.]